MPYPNEHSCRLYDPGLYDEDSFRRIKRDNLVIIIGKRPGEETTEAQAYRYPVGDWTEDEARKHCDEAGGEFHPAKKEAKAMAEKSESLKAATLKTRCQRLLRDVMELLGEKTLPEAVRGSLADVRGAMRKTWEDLEEGKSFSLDGRGQQVRDAWRAQFKQLPMAMPSNPDDCWVKEVFDDQVIIQTPEGLYGYSYTLAADGTVAFGEPVRVELVYQAAGKAASIPGPSPAGAGRGSPTMAVKALREENGGVVVGGHLLLWGDEEHKDLQGEWFTPETALWLDAYKGAPALFHHGLDEAVGLALVGHRVKAVSDDVGVWVEDWLDKSTRYWKFVEPLLQTERLFYSPGSAPHLVKREASGKLLSFPVVEDTLTPIPAQPRLLPVEQVKAVYKAAGIELPDGFTAEVEEGGGSAGALRPEAEQAAARAKALLAQIQIEEV